MLDAISTRQARRTLSPRQVGDWANVRPDTVLGWFRQGKLPGMKLGHHTVRFLETDVVAFLSPARSGNGGAE